jgi:hypothetical protein
MVLLTNQQLWPQLVAVLVDHTVSKSEVLGHSEMVVQVEDLQQMHHPPTDR